MNYHRTKDLLYVKSFLGHRDFGSTLKYVQLIDFGNDEYSCKTAKIVAEATGLMKAGFEYVTDLEGLKLSRKRK
jgi:hypothetical protein